MTSTVKKLPKSQVEITIKVSYEAYKKAEQAALKKISKEIKVDGFRAGHIPEAIVREKVPAVTIEGFTMEELVPTSYTEAVKEHKLFVIAQPKIEVKTPVKNEGDELVYIATVALMPEVDLGDYKKIKVKAKDVKVSKKEVDETIEMLMSRFAEWKDVERAAKNGDRVELDFAGYDEKGVEIPNTASKNHPVVLGSKTMIPGFEDEILGLKVGDEKEFDITFPKEYHAKMMQGKKVTFKVKLGRLEEKKPQVLDEAMVEKISGKKEAVDAFKANIEKDLLAEMKQRAQKDTDNEVVAEIVKMAKAELPETLIQDEINMLKEERQKQVAQQGLTWEQYLAHIKKTEEDFVKDHQKSAEERLLARLAVNKILKQEDIKATDEEVEAKIKEAAERYPEDSRQQVLDYYKPGSEAYRMLKNNLAADKLIKMFIA